MPEATYLDEAEMHAEWVHEIVVGHDGIAHSDMSRSSLAKTQFAPVSKATSHVLLDPLPLGVRVGERGHTRHADRARAVSPPDALERVGREVGLVRVRICTARRVMLLTSGLTVGRHRIAIERFAVGTKLELRRVRVGALRSGGVCHGGGGHSLACPGCGQRL
jgi:hypothetical protein